MKTVPAVVAGVFALGLTAFAQMITVDRVPPTVNGVRNITVSGCLKEGATPDTFRLTRLDTGSREGTVGTGGRDGMLLYHVVGTNILDLTTHVGHRLVVAGTVEPRVVAPAAAPVQSPVRRGRTEPPRPERDTLRVRMLKDTGEICP